MTNRIVEALMNGKTQLKTVYGTKSKFGIEDMLNDYAKEKQESGLFVERSILELIINAINVRGGKLAQQFPNDRYQIQWLLEAVSRCLELSLDTPIYEVCENEFAASNEMRIKLTQKPYPQEYLDAMIEVYDFALYLMTPNSWERNEEGFKKCRVEFDKLIKQLKKMV